MPEPLSEVEAFSLIYQSALETGAVSGQEDYNSALIELHLKKYRRAHSFMKEATVEDYYTFLLTHWSENRRLRRLELEKPAPTAEQFWKAAYDIRFLGNAFINIDLHKFRFRFRNLGVIPLGKLRGSATLDLTAGMSTSGLPTTDKSIFESLDYSTTYFQGISYSDGHPSELEPGFKIRVSESSTLRRFICLGWVRLNKYKDWWDETGHVLVMDIDPGSDRRPWFVLASEVWTSEE